MLHRMRWSLLLAIPPLSACIHYHPKPIDPVQLQVEYEERSLAVPGLRAYLEANMASKFSEWPPSSLDLETLTLIGFYFNPELDVARAKVGIAEAGQITAGARPIPAVFAGGGYTNLMASPLLLKFALDLPIETAHKRGLRIERAGNLTEAAQLELAETAWRIRSRIRAALLQYLFRGEELIILRSERDLRGMKVTLMEARLKAGEVSRPEVEFTREELAAAREIFLAVESNLTQSRTELAEALGLPVTALDKTWLSWAGFQNPPDEKSISELTVQRAGLLNRLDLRRTLAEYAAIEKSLQLEIAKQYPDIVLSPGYSFDDAANKYVLGLSVSLPMFAQKGPIAEAEAHRQEASARFLALQAAVMSQTAKAWTEYRGSLGELREARVGASSAENLETAARHKLERGETDRLVLTEASIRLMARRIRLDAVRKAQVALGALEEAVQRPLEPASGLRIA
ncbi:MAG: TolC family protein [Terriglobia bacterium]